MTKKDDELLSMQYQIEKTGVRQQKLEEGYESVTAALKRSKRNNRIVIGLFLVTIVVLGGLWGYKGKLDKLFQFNSKEKDPNIINEVDAMQMMNDSLHIELAKLKTEIASYKLGVGQQDSINPLENTTPVLSNSVPITQNVKHTKSIQTKTNHISNRKYKKQYCYPIKAYKRGDVGFIEVDYIQFFQGKRALREARKQKKTEYDFNAKGDTIFFLEKNHFISNENKKLRILELDDNVIVKGVNQSSNGFSIKALQKIVARNSVLLLEIKDGIVYRISEKKI